MFLPPYKISIAPMLDWTDRHCRYFLRLLTKHALLYTEMITTGALIHGQRERFLAYDPSEHPLAIQLGGSHPQELAQCAVMAAEHGYDEINLNVGCPSDRVQSGRFGACLMAEPNLVADCVAAMRAVVAIPVTVKTRIGIDNQDSYTELANFVQTVANAGCHTFIIHARKAWLHGLSPKENREIPPLRYDVVAQLKADFPQLTIILNGGITTLEQVVTHLNSFDGLMLGRAAYHNSYLLADIEHHIFNTRERVTREEILQRFLPYIEQQLTLGVSLSHMARHVLGVFQGQPGARIFRRYLSEHMFKQGVGIEVIQAALDAMLNTN